ncbi:Lrp/AsnC family transcriptional regulator [Terasakiella sp. A23]|uniref:Lrp/AsnC family transcriptional regulator n=1 Tax=Terasakiella sp. FCG-A23 TaxID=3080561 RepID=UPI00295503FC|nr:Lrp/AsnC family transcriptional regulator [Terasakiella sp. A23]MDV7339446.1 Lrp/AsnC family transcriptional regulator [Terasakiella sp. A23]
MDQIDRKIIRELQNDARLTNQELSERVNLSPSPCLRRVRKLEEDGVLKGYTALVDQEKYGLGLDVFVLIKLERSQEELIETFERHVNEIDEILECYLITGTADYLLHIVSHSLKSYEKFMRERLTKIPGIDSVETSISFSTVKKQHAFPLMRQYEDL